MRIAYIVLTCELYEKTRKVWQEETVFGGVPREDVYYLGHVMRPSDRLFSWGAADDYRSLPYKFVDFFLHWDKERAEDDYDWYFLMDDDTYLYVDRLKRRVEGLGVDPRTEPYVEGHLMTHVAHTEWGVYPSGGAGTLLSLAAIQGIRRRLRGMVRGGATYTAPHWCADICVGRWTAGMRVVHADEYHTEMSPVAGRKGVIVRRREEKEDADLALTFHHLKTKDDFWAHWLLGKRAEAEAEEEKREEAGAGS